MMKGEDARVVAEVPFKAVVVDSRAAAVFTESAEPSMIILHGTPLVDALVIVFEQLWKAGVPITTHDPDEESVLDARLLALLAAGLKDESIARQLGTSSRTVRRRVSKLMDRLGARTRFQAGMAARDQVHSDLSRGGRSAE